MNIEELIKESNLSIASDKILFNELMKKHTTFKIGGPAECFIKIGNSDELKEVLKIANENQIPVTVIGNGSNILVLDKGIKGITLKIQIEKLEIQNQDNHVKVIVGAGEKIGKIARVFLENELTGLEELSGIPGTIGGAVRMNAGAYGKEIKDIVKSVTCISYDGIERKFTREEMNFGYRSSRLQKERYIVTEIEMELQKGKKEEIKAKMQEYSKSRNEKQPIEFPNAGSTFKRGDGFITAKLIDDAGLKGYSIGDAEVSTKHSGFIINKGNATSENVLQLVKYIQDEVYKKFDKKIELEIEVIGE